MTAPPPPPAPRRRRGSVSKIDRLPPDLRERYERQVLSNPATTAKSARAWLAAEGCAVSPAAVARHRWRFLRDRDRRVYSDALAKWTRELAAPDGLAEEDLAAGAVLRARLGLFKQIRETFRRCHDEHRPASAEELLMFAAGLRAQLGESGLAPTTPRLGPSSSRS